MRRCKRKIINNEIKFNKGKYLNVNKSIDHVTQNINLLDINITYLVRKLKLCIGEYKSTSDFKCVWKSCLQPTKKLMSQCNVRIMIRLFIVLNNLIICLKKKAQYYDCWKPNQLLFHRRALWLADDFETTYVWCNFQPGHNTPRFTEIRWQ